MDFDISNYYQFVIENPKGYREYISELIGQSRGNDGKFVLSEDGKELKIKDNVHILLSPFDIELNSKKIIDAVYKELTELLQDGEMYLEYQSIISGLERFGELVVEQSDRLLEYDFNISEKDIFKLLTVKLIKDSDDFVGSIAEYIKNYAQILKYKVFVCINFLDFFSEEELEQLLNYLSYYQVKLIFVEAAEKKNSLTKCFIIDRDYCEIFSDDVK